ncbi:MAG: rhomboid family intramembrane serine protease [Pirellulales bacterium]|nr:rhomboid family intramembrane serine protease [Pirellulales bacterium]
MRQAGTLSNRQLAERFADYLLTQGISAKVDAEGDRWAIWIHDEDQLPQAREVLREFAVDPEAEKYRSAGGAAEVLREQYAQADEKRRKNLIELGDRWRGGSGLRPLTMAFIAMCIFVSLATNFGKENNVLLQAIMFQSFDENGLAPSATHDIEHGQIWRLVTPIFLHFHPLHLLFNMFWLYDLGSAIETRRGTVRYGLLVLATAALSNYGQYFFSFELKWTPDPSIRFGGMSGVVYGLFGYAWMKSRFDPLVGLRISSQVVTLMIAWLFLCWTGVIGSVANWAHAVGLLSGIAIGYLPIVWRKRMKP